uniref:Uncharacterized protein n=1 Tax=Vannella robusta TaxID=1487602 RepID=A0A7S4I9Y4_9EUKA|mmetsp:Transcript_22572/g.28822  ORF Transcript_22572/g.28822 Transcript_22572/m.28822 type:complete len:168 (+) Transcript_22572:56-559(+)|eukprot:CAMPEP_0206197122 /NCGR_PEP_ID=MMETSP0166-20121206/8845_1 /ASSEMBLY_ACC=CAM_ASM_000260 /TAXON_ID=95228 /ORGANISM="Vannella robusta, Strain DIVA3 518/3/11/1/6" /LENGTH=167 /DNA_ID=CAMNT_0053614707 /DNA_START=21 /DNA_END=524 /DNA_ORIENTATION=+
MIAALEETVPRSQEDELRIKQEIETLNSKKEFIIENPAVLALQPSVISKKPKKKPKNKRPKQPKAYEEDDEDLSLEEKLETPESKHFTEPKKSELMNGHIQFSLSTSQLLTIQDAMLNSIRYLYNDEIHDTIEEQLEAESSNEDAEFTSFVCSPLSCEVNMYNSENQ